MPWGIFEGICGRKLAIASEELKPPNQGRGRQDDSKIKNAGIPLDQVIGRSFPGRIGRCGEMRM